MHLLFVFYEILLAYYQKLCGIIVEAIKLVAYTKSKTENRITTPIPEYDDINQSAIDDIHRNESPVIQTSKPSFAEKKHISPIRNALTSFLVSEDYGTLKLALDNIFSTRINSIPAIRRSSSTIDLRKISQSRLDLINQIRPHTNEDISKTVTSFNLIQNSETCPLHNTNPIEISLLHDNIQTNEFFSEIFLCIADIAFKYNVDLCQHIITRLLSEVESVVVSMLPSAFLRSFSGYCLSDVKAILFHLQKNPASFLYVKDATKQQKQAYFAYLAKTFLNYSKEQLDLKTIADEFCGRSVAQTSTFETISELQTPECNSISSIPQIYWSYHDENNNGIPVEENNSSHCLNHCNFSNASQSHAYFGFHDQSSMNKSNLPLHTNDITSSSLLQFQSDEDEQFCFKYDSNRMHEIIQTMMFELELLNQYPITLIPNKLPLILFNEPPYLEKVFDEQIDSINKEDINSFPSLLTKQEEKEYAEFCKLVQDDATFDP